MSSSKDILNNPSKWPASFPKPKAKTRVLTYVFKDNSKVETFLTFLKEKRPRALVKVVKDDKGYTNVTITQASTPSATADTANGLDCFIGYKLYFCTPFSCPCTTRLLGK